MRPPFCRASVANRCSFESACLRKLLIWMLQPLTSMCTNGLDLQRPFVPRIAERQLYQRQARQRMAHCFMPLALHAATSVATQGSEWPVSNLSGAGRTCMCCTSCSGASEVPSKSWRVTSEHASRRSCRLSVLFRACPCRARNNSRSTSANSFSASL